MAASASDPLRIEGRAFPPGSAHETPATLVLTDDRARLEDGEGTVLREVPRDQLRLDTALGWLERKIHLPDKSVFLTRDTDAVARGFAHHAGDRLHRWEHFGPKLIIVVVAALVAFGAIWRFGLPALVSLAVALTPEGMPRRMDQSTLAFIDRLGGANSTVSASRQDELKVVFQDIVAQIDDPRAGAQYRLLFRHMGGELNAFALPGGTVIFTDAMVMALEDDNDAVAGIMGHEIAHVEEAHSLHALYEALGLYLIIVLLAGDTGPLLEEILLEGNTLLSLASSRDAEAEADAVGIRLAADAGYDPEGLARFFELLRTMYGEGGGWLSTHPGNDDRAARIRQLARDLR